MKVKTLQYKGIEFEHKNKKNTVKVYYQGRLIKKQNV